VDEVRISPAHFLDADLGSDLRRVDAVRAAGKDQQRLAVGAEHQAVGDSTDLAVKLGRRSGRSRGGLGKLADHALDTGGGKLPGNVLRVLVHWLSLAWRHERPATGLAQAAQSRSGSKTVGIAG
jgi:hypothetical protein